jgi:hypothetical protein
VPHPAGIVRVRRPVAEVGEHQPVGDVDQRPDDERRPLGDPAQPEAVVIGLVVRGVVRRDDPGVALAVLVAAHLADPRPARERDRAALAVAEEEVDAPVGGDARRPPGDARAVRRGRPEHREGEREGQDRHEPRPRPGGMGGARRAPEVERVHGEEREGEDHVGPDGRGEAEHQAGGSRAGEAGPLDGAGGQADEEREQEREERLREEEAAVDDERQVERDREPGGERRPRGPGEPERDRLGQHRGRGAEDRLRVPDDGVRLAGPGVGEGDERGVAGGGEGVADREVAREHVEGALVEERHVADEVGVERVLSQEREAQRQGDQEDGHRCEGAGLPGGPLLGEPAPDAGGEIGEGEGHSRRSGQGSRAPRPPAPCR